MTHPDTTPEAFQRSMNALSDVAAGVTDQHAEDTLPKAARALAFIALRRSGCSTLVARDLEDALAEYMLNNLA